MIELSPLPLEDALARLEDLKDIEPTEVGRGDSRDGAVYVTNPDLVRAARVALITGRPLVVGGPPGGGKSSFAAYLARNLEVAYYEFAAVDESRSTDVLWSLDGVRRLSEAQAGRLAKEPDDLSFARYLTPGPLWWAFNPALAASRGLSAERFEAGAMPPAPDPRKPLAGEPRHEGAVVLIDEIDKADNAFSNGLLVPLGSRTFDMPQLGATVSAAAGWSPLIVISTNNERDLPDAFQRRCLFLEIDSPSADQLTAIAHGHLPERYLSVEVRTAIASMANLVVEEQAAVSAAEFLDLVRLLVETDDLDPSSEEWALVRRLVMSRHSGGPARRW